LIFLYLKQMTNRIIAVITLIPLQLNCYYFVPGLTPLSETTFWVTLSVTLYLILIINNDHGKERKLLAFLAGLACCLVFLSRQIGIIVIVFIAIIFLIQWLAVFEKQRKVLNRNFLFILSGWLIIFVPYATILYSQTGQGPLTQGFRKHNYMVTVKDPEILKQIEAHRTLPPELLTQIESAPQSDYGRIYAERRRMRKLLPDASEMYSYVIMEEGGGAGYLKRAFSSFKNPKDYLHRFYNNLIHLNGPLGYVLTTLFFVLCFLPFLIKSNKTKLLNRLLLPLFIIFYLIIISFLTDKIDRYIYILFPFCLMHISAELFICFNALMDVLRLKRFSNLILPVSIFSIILLTTPNFFTAFQVIPKAEGMENKYDYLKEYIKGAPVFGLAPYDSYIAGGSFRMLPNDSLEKVVQYGKKTGVRWLLIVRTLSTANQLNLYDNAQWYFERSLEKSHPDLVKFRAGTPDTVMALYEIL
jgi:4-amino-4-deoxy-L-arabinose transferase-like glycosyltransferase